jgi:hypothetical protein
MCCSTRGCCTAVLRYIWTTGAHAAGRSQHHGRRGLVVRRTTYIHTPLNKTVASEKKMLCWTKTIFEKENDRTPIFHAQAINCFTTWTKKLISKKFPFTPHEFLVAQSLFMYLLFVYKNRCTCDMWKSLTCLFYFWTVRKVHILSPRATRKHPLDHVTNKYGYYHVN